MSFVNSQRDLIKFALEYTMGRPVEMTQAVLKARAENQLITESDTQFDDGKKRRLHFNYYPPVCADNGAGNENICNTGTVLQPKQDFFEISQVTASAVYQLNPDDIRYMDNSYTFSQNARAQIMSVLPTVREKLDSAITALIVANVGLLPNGNASQLLPVLNKENGVVNPMGLWEIERAYRDSGYSNPYIVGGTDVFHWKKATAIGGLNANGQYIDKMVVPNLYYSGLVNTTFGSPSAEHIVSFDPQMLKFVTFSRNAGMFATDEISIDAIDEIYSRGSDNRLKGVMPDPVTGLIWDLNIHYDDCLNNGNGGWKFQWKLEWDIFFMPAKVCNKQGVNGIFHWTTCLQTVPECPTGSIIEPADSATYEFDTNGEITFPIIVQKVQVGGIISYPAEAESGVANIAGLRDLLNGIANGIVFSVSSTKLQYTGYAAVTVTLNGGLTGEEVMAFTEA